MSEGLRILGLADLHDCTERLRDLKDLKCDLIAFCGDLHNGSSRERARPAAMALACLGPPVLIVPGNMDHRDVVPVLWEKAGFIMLHQSSFRHKEYGFIGMGGMIAKDPRRLGDPNRYYHRDEEVYSILEKAYQEVSGARAKIVIVHQPPRGAQDILYNGERSGSLELRRFIENFQPDLVLCGHIHEDRGECLIGSTLVVNVGELRRGYGAMIELNDEITVEGIRSI